MAPGPRGTHDPLQAAHGATGCASLSTTAQVESGLFLDSPVL